MTIFFSMLSIYLWNAIYYTIKTKKAKTQSQSLILQLQAFITFCLTSENTLHIKRFQAQNVGLLLFLNTVNDRFSGDLFNLAETTKKPRTLRVRPRFQGYWYLSSAPIHWTLDNAIVQEQWGINRFSRNDLLADFRVLTVFVRYTGCWLYLHTKIREKQVGKMLRMFDPYVSSKKTLL